MILVNFIYVYVPMLSVMTVYTTTSADPRENAYACYWNSSVNAYLGGEYSTSWMEYVDQVSHLETIMCPE